MQKKNFTIIGENSLEIFGFKYEPETQVKAVVLIVHGMAEHSARYENFASFLCSNGFACYAYDQRGHGKTAGSIENLGFFAENKGWEIVVKDLQKVVNTVKNEHPEKKIFIFGHSMGSFIVRSYISCEFTKVNGVILSASAGSNGFLAKIGLMLSNIIMIFSGKKSPSPLMNKLSFGAYNNQFKPVKTDFDWLSRDENNVKKYIEDPYCGTVFSIGFFKDLIWGLEDINLIKTIEKIDKNLPVFFLSGNKDPVSKNGNQIIEIVENFRKAGVLNVEYTLIENGRHESLNEINKDEVYKLILNVLERFISLTT